MKFTRTILGGVTAAVFALTGLASPVLAVPAPDSMTKEAGDLIGVPAIVENSSNKRISQWQDLQFGLFMHWGVYSMFEGSYKGQVQQIGYPEQIKAWMKISDEAYLEEAAKMTATHWDAAKVCQKAKDAGMKYVMITTKHHDGFAMWDTATTDFNVVKKTAFGLDPIKQLSTECGKIGIKLALYFSIIDWTQHEAEPYGNVNPITEDMMNRIIKPQIDELMTNYGPIAEFWFDMGAPTPDQSQRMAAWVHAHQSDTMVNSRVWNDKGDFEVGGDNSVPRDFRIGPWESILSIFPACWSYCSDYRANRNVATIPKKTSSLVKSLITTISGGGQFDLNIGPKGDGSFDPYDQKVLDGIGAWMKRHPHAITGAKATWFPIPSWGRITANSNVLYLFPHKWTQSETLTLEGLGSTVKSVVIDGTTRPLDYVHEGTKLTITLSGTQPDTVAPVIAVTLNEPAKMIPAHLVTLDKGVGSVTQFSMDGHHSANGGTTARIDSYFVDRSGKDRNEVRLTFSGSFDKNTSYRITFGEHSVVKSGADIMAGSLDEVFSMRANQVTRASIELAHPSYYTKDVNVSDIELKVEVFDEVDKNSAPVFRSEPSDVEVTQGQTVTLSASAVSIPPASYQWFRIAPGQNQATPIDSQTHSRLSFEAQLSDNGAKYYVVATNPYGHTRSATASLTVTPASNNLALGKAATQISTGWGGSASRANDGNTDGVWDHNSVSHTGHETNPWWQVDLGDEYAITGVNVWNRSDMDMCSGITCDQRLKDFWVVASRNELPADFDPVGHSVEGVTAMKIEGVGGFPSHRDFSEIPARYVRVILPGDNAELTLAEVEVFGKKSVTGTAPRIAPITIDAENMEALEMAGDGMARTVTAPKGTIINLVAQVEGDPEPDLQWQRKDAGSNEWSDLEDEVGDITSLELVEVVDGAMYRLRASNALGTVESGTIEFKLKEGDPAPDPTPDPGVKPDLASVPESGKTLSSVPESGKLSGFSGSLRSSLGSGGKLESRFGRGLAVSGGAVGGVLGLAGVLAVGGVCVVLCVCRRR